jgi:hypothetical protein
MHGRGRTVYKDRMMRFLRVLAWCSVVTGVAAGCTQNAKKPPQKTSLNGTVFNRNFEGATAAFAQEPGPPRGILIRVSNRSDTCLAASDPSDPLDPSILISIVPDQEGNYAIAANGTSTGERFATATLYTYTDLPDGGVPEGTDAGLRPVLKTATGGYVNVTALDPAADDGRLNAELVLLFGDGGFVGQVGAYPCDRVR